MRFRPLSNSCCFKNSVTFAAPFQSASTVQWARFLLLLLYSNAMAVKPFTSSKDLAKALPSSPTYLSSPARSRSLLRLKFSVACSFCSAKRFPSSPSMSPSPAVWKNSLSPWKRFTCLIW